MALLDPYYFPRKNPNQLCLILDLRDTNQDIYPVPVEIEHVDFVSVLVGEEIRNNPELAQKIIPSNLIIDSLDKKVTSIVTGVCGMETAFNVRHLYDDLWKAHNIVKGFINLGEEFKLEHNLYEDKIIRRYCIK